MPDVILKLDEQHADKSKEALSALFDEEVERFSAFMGGLGDARWAGPLSRPERALIKTYLVQKLRGAF